MVTKTRVSIEEYFALPSDEKPYLEYVSGEVVAKAFPNQEHSDIVARLVALAAVSVAAQGGRVYTENRTGYADPVDPRYMLPDVSLYARGRALKAGRVMAAPTLAIEVLSPDQTMPGHRERCRYYLAHGVDEAWIIDPRQERVECYTASGMRVFTAGQTVGSDTLPGFDVDLGALFADLDADFA